MAQSASLSSSVAGRYAQALFDIASQEGDLDALADQVTGLGETLEGSDELRAALASPAIGRGDQRKVIDAVAKGLSLSPVFASTLSLMADNGRAFAMPQLVRALGALIADARGETTAEVVSAQALTPEQAERLTRTLSEKSGRTVKLDTKVDEGLIGGMIVKLGSQMIDTSVRSRLSSLQNSMKEVR